MNLPNQSGCRFCRAKLEHTFVDLGMSPLCETYLPADHLNQMEPFYPLYVQLCGKCFLVQLKCTSGPNRFSATIPIFFLLGVLARACQERYTDQMVERFGIGANSFCH